MGFEPPPAALAAELVYWREDGVRHTLLTIAGPLFAERLGISSATLTFALHDTRGAFLASWTRELVSTEVVFVDSREFPRVGATEGVLVVWVTNPSAPRMSAAQSARAMSMVDWFSDDGQLCSLHNDQSIDMLAGEGEKKIELTEIVIAENTTAATSLVVVNGPSMQAPGALEIVVRNHTGDERTVTYPSEMPPFSLHKIGLRDLVPDLVAFCAGRDATIRGSFAARGIFTRPYVLTEGSFTSAYHGGDRYRMPSIPGMVHRTFPYAEAEPSIPAEVFLVTGQKEMNPAYAVHGPKLTTSLHLFQSHGDVEEDFAVDATLYDRSGRVIAHRERWAIAPRHGARRCEVADLVKDPFEGHIALRFSDDPHEVFPRRLQALMEYRSPTSLARTMLWSDRWNAPDRLRSQRTFRALYRVFSGGDRSTTLAVTNPGVGRDYTTEAPYRVLLQCGGEELVHEGVLAPHATLVATIEELFPKRPSTELCLAIVESTFDLASVQLTTDRRSNVVAVEHLLPVIAYEDEKAIVPCGS